MYLFQRVSVSTQFMLLDVVLYSAYYVHHSLLHVIIHFIFLFVVDKHDIEPSHRCMSTQRAQLSTTRLSTRRSEGGDGGVDGTLLVPCTPK